MNAVASIRYLPIDDAEAFVDVDLPEPVPWGQDVLVEMKAVTVNLVDSKVRGPKDKLEPMPRVLGSDAAGIVAAAGPDASLFLAGDEVCYTKRCEG